MDVGRTRRHGLQGPPTRLAWETRIGTELFWEDAFDQPLSIFQTQHGNLNWSYSAPSCMDKETLDSCMG